MIEFEKVYDLFTDFGMSDISDLTLYINTISNETGYLSEEMERLTDDEDIQITKKRIGSEPGWVQLPDRRELDLGSRLPVHFAEDHLSPEDCDQVHDFFRHSGAYRNFRALLDRLNKTDDWYQYQDNAIREALKEWLRDNDIEFSE